MEAAEVHEVREFFEPDLPVEIVAHAGRDAPQQPGGEAAPRRWRRQGLDRRMTLHEPHTQEIDRLLHEEPGRGAVACGLVAEDLEQAGDRWVLERYPHQHFHGPAAGDRVGAGLKVLLREIDV